MQAFLEQRDHRAHKRSYQTVLLWTIVSQRNVTVLRRWSKHIQRVHATTALFRKIIYQGPEQTVLLRQRRRLKVPRTFSFWRNSGVWFLQFSIIWSHFQSQKRGTPARLPIQIQTSSKVSEIWSESVQEYTRAVAFARIGCHLATSNSRPSTRPGTQHVPKSFRSTREVPWHSVAQWKC